MPFLSFIIDKTYDSACSTFFFTFAKNSFPMRKTASFLVWVAVALGACNKYESPSSNGNTPLPSHVDPVYHVGDHFKNDTLEGVVFLTYDGHNGLMVSLEETQLSWCIPNYVNSETGATNPYDGWRNTNIVMSNYDLRHFPAVQWSHLRNTWQLVHYNYPIVARQWFVPSSGELAKLLQNRAAVDATLDAMGYPTMEGKTYWSSTELGTKSAAALQVQDSSVVVKEVVKDQVLFVRAVRNF